MLLAPVLDGTIVPDRANYGRPFALGARRHRRLPEYLTDDEMRRSVDSDGSRFGKSTG